jgi:membrane-associated phospholipid phosphatase
MSLICKTVLLVLCLLAGTSMPLQAQYRQQKVQWKKDLGLLTLGGAGTLSGYLLQRQMDPLTVPELDALSQTDLSTLNFLDRSMQIQWRPSVARASDVLLLGTAALPFAIAMSQGRDEKSLNLSLLSLQTLTYTASLTNWTKYLAQRARPFTYLPAGNDLVLRETQMAYDARTSFFSGHTSMATTGSLLSAQIFSYYHPDSPYRPLVWAGAVLLPAAVGYMRVRAGKHFPSDVMAGYLVGASVALINFRLHLDRP